MARIWIKNEVDQKLPTKNPQQADIGLVTGNIEMVEARGVEPLSETSSTLVSTRLALNQAFGCRRLQCRV